MLSFVSSDLNTKLLPHPQGDFLYFVNNLLFVLLSFPHFIMLLLCLLFLPTLFFTCRSVLSALPGIGEKVI